MPQPDPNIGKEMRQLCVLNIFPSILRNRICIRGRKLKLYERRTKTVYLPADEPNHETAALSEIFWKLQYYFYRLSQIYKTRCCKFNFRLHTGGEFTCTSQNCHVVLKTRVSCIIASLHCITIIQNEFSFPSQFFKSDFYILLKFFMYMVNGLRLV